MLRAAFLAVLLLAQPTSLAEPAPPPPPDPAAAWAEIARLVPEHFRDPDLNGLDWAAITTETAGAIESDPVNGAAHIRQALRRLEDGHTAFFTPSDRAYYELLDVFNPKGVLGHPFLPNGEPVRYVGIGLVTTEIDGKPFVYDIYPGGPADVAGVRTGDELISVDGGPWGDIVPFIGREGRPMALEIRRERGGPVLTLGVTPRSIQPRELFLKTIRNDTRVIDRGGRRIGYIRARSHAHPSYTERVESLVLERFGDAESLVFDMRGGWGGGSMGFLPLFHPAAPEITHIPRQGTPRTWRTGWSRPVAVVIAGGTRSAKEILAHAFTRHPGVTLVGETTAGAVTAGRLFTLVDGSLLYLGIADVLVDGQRLEGVGVDPDVRVERPLAYENGLDPQIEAAIDMLVEQLSEPRGDE